MANRMKRQKKLGQFFSSSSKLCKQKKRHKIIYYGLLSDASCIKINTGPLAPDKTTSLVVLLRPPVHLQDDSNILQWQCPIRK